MTGRRALSDLGVAITVAVLVHGPLLLHRGFALRGDMVFVPRQPWKDTWLGLDDSVARFVPGDALVSLATQVVPGDLLQKVLLVGGFVLGGVGAARLVAWATGLGRASAVVLFLWNPWVHDRLAIGQWGVVVGYLLLPWTALAAVRLRDRLPGGASAVVAWLGAAAIFSPASGLVALVTALAVVLVRPRLRSVAATLGAGVLVNLPWILPSLLGSAPGTAPAGQFGAFRTSGESSLGTLASVLSLGGIWKTSVVAPERTSVVIVLLACALTVVALAGLRWVPREQRALVVGLGALAAAAVLLALVTAVPAVSRALDDLAAQVPAAGLLRDSQRYLGPAALVLLPGLAAVVSRLQSAAVHGREGLRVLAVLVVLFPVLCLPSMFWGLGGGLRPVGYPSEWNVVRDTLPQGRTVVLPWRGGYRGFAWNDERAMLDPAPRFFPGDVLVDDRLYVDGRVLASENPLLGRVDTALRSADPVAGLRDLGVRSVLVEKGNGPPPPDLRGAEVLHDGPELMLLDLGTSPPRPTRTPGRTVILVTDALVLACWLVAVVSAAVRRRPEIV